MENSEVVFKDELDKKRMLEYILKIAQMRQISQSKLIEGIYDKSHFNRMCNGKENINFEVILACAQKLEIPIHQFIQVSLDNTYSSLYSEFENALYSSDFHHLSTLLEKIEPFHDAEFIRLKLNINGILAAEQHKDYPTAIKFFKKALEISCPNISKIHTYSCLSMDEIKILENLALCYFFNGNDQAFRIFEKLITDIPPLINEYNNHIFDKLCYNYSLLCLRTENYQDCLYYCEKGIASCLTYHNFLYLGYLHYNKAYAAICLFDEATCVQSLTYAKDIFTVQNKFAFFKKALLHDKSIFEKVLSLII